VIPAQRHALILEELQTRGTVSIQDLSNLLETSSSTVRRDLDYLAKRQYLERTFGGAQLSSTLIGSTFEPEYEIEQHTRADEKRAIGRLAASLIPSGTSVFLDSSSTVWQAADFIAASRSDLTVVTNDLTIAARLARTERITTMVTGGTIRAYSYTLLGPPGTDFVSGLWVDAALLGTHSLGGGILSDSSVDVVEFKRGIMRASKRKIVLADSSKFAKARSFGKVAELGEIDALVTDAGISDEDREIIERAGVELHVAGLDSQ